jgi:outer membrane receptor for ferrienterochelin and colicins
MAPRSIRLLLPVVALALLARPALAQSGSITGRITDSTSRAPIASARVQAVGGPTSVMATSGEDGSYRLVNLAAGTYSVVVTRIGYSARRVENLRVESAAVTADVVMSEIGVELNPVVTTASRKAEKALDAPASVAVVELREIQERPAVTVADHLKSVPGVDINQGGVGQSNIVARGFNNAFSGSILTLQDYRFAGVPSLRVNVPLLFTSTNEDIERIEVLLGPASALYGPNSANGVLHVITKSPFTSQGTMLTLDGGERSLLRGSIRHAGLVTPKVGYKFSGEYFTAKDFKYDDRGEPDVWPAEAPAGRRGQPVARNFDLNRFAGEARLDIRPSDEREFVTTYGLTRIGEGLEYTGANGTAQVKGWTYQSLQQRARLGRLFAQAFVNFSDAGNSDSLSTDGTFLLRSGQPIVDQSRVFAGQLQHGFALGARQDFVYGADYIFTNPRTGGTINGRNEDDDNVTEIGGYVQSTTKLSSMFDFIGAIRVDNNDRIEGTQVSPRAALIFKPKPTQNFRVTFNRAFNTPANFSYFLDLIQARDVGGISRLVPGLQYNVRALGNPPKTGWTYNRSCADGPNGLCMKSTFVSGNQWAAASAHAAYPGVVSTLAPALVQQLTPAITQLLISQGVPPAQAGPLAAQRAQALIGGLAALRPTATQVPGRIAFLSDQQALANPAYTGRPATDFTSIGPLEASYNKTYELGYKGIIGNRVRLAIDGWYQQRGDVGNPAGLATPNVFFQPGALGTYLGQNIAGALIAQGIPQATAAATASQIATGIVTQAAALPLGIVQFNDDRFANGRDVYATYTSNRNQEIDIQGVDVALDIVATDRWTLAGTYSWMSDVIFEDVTSSNSRPLMLNAPDNKASLSVRYRDEPRGLGFEVRGRYANAYPVNSGVYATDVRFPRPGVTNQFYFYEPVGVNTTMDAGFNYRLNVAGARQVMWSLNATNLFDRNQRTFPGAPEIGRMIVTRIQYAF